MGDAAVSRGVRIVGIAKFSNSAQAGRFLFELEKRKTLKQRSAGFQTCCIAGFQAGKTPQKLSHSADLEIRDTADLEVCATSADATCLRPHFFFVQHALPFFE